MHNLKDQFSLKEKLYIIFAAVYVYKNFSLLFKLSIISNQLRFAVFFKVIYDS